MTRKHYNVIADALYSDLDADKTYHKFEIVQLITNALRGTNPNYQPHRFYNAAMNGRKSSKHKTR